MKKVILSILVLFLLFTSSALAASNGMIKRQVVNGIYPEMSYEDMIKILGEPKLVEKDRVIPGFPDNSAMLYYDNGLAIRVMKRKEQKVKPGMEKIMRYVPGGVFVKRIIVKSPKIAFDSGLRVGMSEMDVLNIYGDTPDKRRTINNLPEYYSYSMMWNGVAHLLTISFDDYGRVSEIQYK